VSALYLNTDGGHVSLHGERLVVQLPPPEKGADDPEPVEVFLRDISQVTVAANVQMTMQALYACMEREIPVVFTRGGSRIVGYCVAAAAGGAARRCQYERLGDPVFRLGYASQLIQAKIRNQRRLLQRLAARRGQTIEEDLRALNGAMDRAKMPVSLDGLRGVEGAAAARYFEALARYFPEGCPFERRSRRPPHNEANALLSYGYTLLMGELEVECLGSGLDPTAGFYHEPEDGRPSLALDLLEPFRAAVSDALALDLLNHQTLKPGEHFDRRDGGVFLNRDGRKLYVEAYERRMSRVFVYEKTGQRTSLRGELGRCVLATRNGIQENNPVVEAFEMN
jgi:CRISPR-associated protein Cas1